MKEVLEYHGKPITWDPVRPPLSVIRSCLEEGDPVVVTLEPGDMTCYVLMLVPLVSVGGLARFGIPMDETGNYLLVVKLATHGRNGGWDWVPWNGSTIYDHDVTNLSPNEWSRTFLAWWLDELQRRI